MLKLKYLQTPQMAALCALAVLLISAAGCGGETKTDLNPSITPQHANPAAELAFPLDLPEDALMPWEELSPAGFAIPNTEAREAAAISDDSLFAQGVDSFAEGGSATPLGRALNLSSGNVGSGELSHAVYRIPLEGETPSIVSADINLAETSSGLRSQYYLAVSDYSAGRWKFHGPFSDSHVRIGLPDDGSYASSLGNIFVAVFAWDGSALDVVGLGVTTVSSGDSTAPPVPSAPQLTPVNGGLLIEWLPVSAGDLAGYRIYYRNGSFVDQLATGVKTVPYIEGLERHLLGNLASETFVRISAVDTSGNESALSPIASATPLSGPAGTVLLETDATNVLINDTVTLTASGAESYDFDLDGDGDFEITGNTSGIVQADTSALGLIRPAVRGTGSGGTAVALGGVSLIVAVNIPPVAILTADSLEGRIYDGASNPYSINFNASQSYDQDGGSLEYAFDLNADGLLGAFNSNPLRTGNFGEKGVYYVGLAVRDSAGLVDQSAVAVSIYQLSDFQQSLVAGGEVYGVNQFFSLAEVEGNPAIAYQSSSSNSGLFYIRALDAQGTVWGPRVLLDNSNNSSTGYAASLAVIAGNPAIAYVDTADNEMRYIRSATTTGQSLSHWTSPPVDIETSVSLSSYNIEMTNVAGNPAVLYAVGNNLFYQRATGASGTGNSAGDWTADPFSIALQVGTISGDVSLAVVSGNPAACYIYNSELFYLRSTTASGASALDWPATAIKISGTRTANTYNDLTVVQGNPAVAFYDTTTSANVSYIRSLTPSGTDVADWPSPATVYDGQTYSSNGYVSMTTLNGIPVISHWSNGQGFSPVRYHEPLDPFGGSWGEGRVAAGSFNMGISSYTEFASVDGLPAVIAIYNSAVLYSSPKPQL